jgi:HK97 family phage portal protein
VIAARVPGRYERLCLERHERDLARARTDAFPFYFDPAAAERPVKFVETYCRHHKGEWAGRPLLLEEWQKNWIRIAFGWKRVGDGTRRFRVCYVEIPRKNGKSELAGGLALYLQLADDEPGAEIYASATKQDQARIVWSTSAAMVRASPTLRKYAKTFRNSIEGTLNGSTYKPLGADSNTLDGLNPHGNIVDELHAHRDRGVWDVLDTAMGARRQPMTIAITTAGTYSAESIGWQQHEHAKKVLDGVLDDEEFFAFVASIDEGDDAFSEAAQAKANPNFGVSVKADYLAKQASKAQQQPSFLNTYLRLHLNVWTQQLKRWLPVDKWNACDVQLTPAAAREREESLRGRACMGGLDLAAVLDLAAFVLVFPETLDVVCRFYLPQATCDRYEDEGKRHYAAWAREGWLTLTPGETIDYEWIKRDVRELGQRYAYREIGFDPWGATQIANDLLGEGFPMVAVQQGFKTLSEPSKRFEARSSRRRSGTRQPGAALLRVERGRDQRPGRQHQAGQVEGERKDRRRGRDGDGAVACDPRRTEEGQPVQVQGDSRPMKIFGVQIGRKSGGETHTILPPTNSAELARYVGAGATSGAGVTVTPERALYLGAVFSCVRVIAESIGQLPLHLLVQSGRERRKAEEHPLYRTLKTKPNHWQTPQEWKEFTGACLALRGNAYSLISRGPRFVELHPLMPGNVSPKRLDTGDVVYDVAQKGGPKRYAAADVLHTKLFPTGDGLLGASPVQFAREAIGLGIATEQHGARLFANGARPGGILTTTQDLGAEGRANVRESWENFHSGVDNAHRVAVLEYGLTYEQIGMSSEDAQFLETRKFQRSEIAGLFRVPPHMIGDLERATFSNIEHQGLSFVTQTLMPYLTRIEERINVQCLTDAEQATHYARFNAGAMMRGDSASRATYYATMFNVGALSSNDIREFEDLNPREGGDTYLTPANMVPVPNSTAPEVTDPDPDLDE